MATAAVTIVPRLEVISFSLYWKEALTVDTKCLPEVELELELGGSDGAAADAALETTSAQALLERVGPGGCPGAVPCVPMTMHAVGCGQPHAWAPCMEGRGRGATMALGMRFHPIPPAAHPPGDLKPGQLCVAGEAPA